MYTLATGRRRRKCRSRSGCPRFRAAALGELHDEGQGLKTTAVRTWNQTAPSPVSNRSGTRPRAPATIQNATPHSTSDGATGSGAVRRKRRSPTPPAAAVAAKRVPLTALRSSQRQSSLTAARRRLAKEAGSKPKAGQSRPRTPDAPPPSLPPPSAREEREREKPPGSPTARAGDRATPATTGF
jgi:hypothetical protein